MKAGRVLLVLAAFAVLDAGGGGLAQPPIPMEKIPKEIPGDVVSEISKLHSPDAWSRHGGALLLGKKGERAAPAVPFLVGMLGENAIAGSSTPGKEAADALVKIGDPAVDAVVGVLRDPGAPEEVRKTAASILGRIKDPRAVGPLTLGLSDRVAGVRTAAAGALGELRDARAAGPLVAALKDHPSPDVVLGALEKVGAPSVEGLIGVFGDKGAAGGLRGKAASSLGRLKDRRAVEPLIDSLKDKTGMNWSEFPGTAAEALGKIGDARAVEPLIDLLGSSNSTVVYAARDALIKITGQDVKYDVSAWRSWWEKNRGRLLPREGR